MQNLNLTQNVIISYMIVVKNIDLNLIVALLYPPHVTFTTPCLSFLIYKMGLGLGPAV